MTRAQSEALQAHWSDKEVRARRDASFRRRREIRDLNERLTFLLDRVGPQDPRIAEVRQRIADLEGGM